MQPPKPKRRARRPAARLIPMDVTATFAEMPDGSLVRIDGRLGVFHRGTMPAAAGLVLFGAAEGRVVDPDDRARFVAWPAHVMGLVLAAARGAKLDLSELARLETEDTRAIQAD